MNVRPVLRIPELPVHRRAVFVVLAAFVPEARRESLAAAAILIAVAWFGVPLLVRLFMRGARVLPE